jgi:phospholipid transport system substrate-binding protein
MMGKPMLRRTILAAGLSLIAGAASAAAPAATAAAPAAIIANLANELRVVVRTASPEQRSAQFHALLRKAFDIPSIARFALGRYWLIATPPEQQEFVMLFEDHLVRNYGTRLSGYGDNEVLR